MSTTQESARTVARVMGFDVHQDGEYYVASYPGNDDPRLDVRCWGKQHFAEMLAEMHLDAGL